jgi:hypothetical protein
MADTREPPPRRQVSPVRAGAAIAIAVAIAFVVWLFVRDDDSKSSTPPTTTSTTTRPTSTTTTQPILIGASAADLRRYAALAGHPVYWIGPRTGFTYELTQTTSGRIYIRYLPRGVRVGDKRAKYTIVGTYPVENADDAIETAARQDGGVKLQLQNGRVGVYNTSSPTNVYFANRGSNYQVEVFDPNPERARNLVLTGAVRPIP